MNSFIYIATDPEIIKNEIKKRLTSEFKVSFEHPDVLFLDQGAKLGMEVTKKIREHLSFKPFSSEVKVVVMIGADALTPDAQNSLLKTLEEPAEQAFLFLGTGDESKLIETLRSRCQIIDLESPQNEISSSSIDEMKLLLEKDIDEKYKYIETTDDKEAILDELISYYRASLGEGPESSGILKELLNAKKWIKQNVNIRPVLEYIMLLTEKEGISR